MKRLVGLTILLLLLALPAAATQCETFTNHSGFVPDGWTATFTEDETDYGPYQGPTFVDPELAHEGNRSWDRAVKCRTVENTTTTTVDQPSSTTTTPTESTTSTAATSTTASPPTTTTPSTTTSTLPALSSTASTPSTTGPSTPDAIVVGSLPYTGTGDVWLIAGALSLLTGVGVLTATRREDS